MRRAVALSILAVGLLGSPSTLYAQALGTIAGVVKDASDAVLPGVTVEASSPALIEKTRSVVTDGRGQFTMVNLPPGTYGVSFNFPGFATVSRQAIDVSVGVTVTVNITMRVGGVAETVTVTGQTPVVDLQSTAQTTVANARAFKELPTGGSWVNMAQIRLFALLHQHLFPARRLDEPAELQPRDLRPGFLDAEEADVSRGTPARLPERIGRRVHRDAGSLAAEQERGLSGSEGRPELEGREPADQRRVRPVGKRQDSHQGEREPKRDAGLGGDCERQQSGQHHSHDGRPSLARLQWQRDAGLRPDEPELSSRRRPVRGVGQPEFRQTEPLVGLRPGDSQRVGCPAVQLGILRGRAARADPSPLGQRPHTSGGSSATSPSPTTSSWVLRITVSTA